MTYTLHPDAELDLANALDFYVATAGAAVGKRFLREFERVAALVVQYPESAHLLRNSGDPFR